MIDPYHATIADLETYAEATHASAIYLQLELLGIRNIAADHTGSHIGKAYGLVTLLRATPFHTSRRRTYLPSELFAKVRLMTTLERVCTLISTTPQLAWCFTRRCISTWPGS
jgi:NADH dehydrogenase [ubiquinone] 1 alpha subcomplex assembly factor 6